jgi:hypothetical protein
MISELYSLLKNIISSIVVVVQERTRYLDADPIYQVTPPEFMLHHFKENIQLMRV